MSIYNFSIGDDSPYNAPNSDALDFRSDVEKQFPNIQLYDPNNPDIAMAMSLARENINVCGASVVVYARTDNADVDEVWGEDADPSYWQPFDIKAFFVPKPLEMELTKWGVDIPNDTDIVFCRQDIIEKLGERILRVGDVIQVPNNSIAYKPKNYIVKNAQEIGNYMFNWLYIKCNTELLSGDITVQPVPVENPDAE